MSSQSVVIGAEIASIQPPTSQLVAADAPPSTIKQLLEIVSRRGGTNVPMLRTTAMRLSEFTNQPFDQISIEALIDAQFAFRAYLKERRYSYNSVRAYCNNAQSMLRWAEELGWKSSKQPLEEVWRPFIAAAKKRRGARVSIIALAIRNGKNPSEFSDADFENWREWMLRSGRQHRTVNLGIWNFRRAMILAGLVELLPNLQIGPKKPTYRVPVSDLPEPLRTEVIDLLQWKQARFAKGRPQRTRHRAVSAKLLEFNICRLYGFAVNIGGFKNVDTLQALFADDVVSAYVEWGLNRRKLSRSTLLHLSMLYGAMRHNPKYKNHDYSWFSSLFDEVPEDDKSLIQEKKARKYVPYDTLQTIPRDIRAVRCKLKGEPLKASWLVHDELLMLWLTTLPWRQRNIRECRIGDANDANVFFAPLPPLIHIAKPKWVEDALKADPQQSFWQFRFRENETKTGQQVRGILPRRLISLLEQYLAHHRPRIVTTPDPGTLFLNRDGAALDRQNTTNHIAEIVLKHTGRRMTPHLFRDAFAYAYLEAHPEDYLTLSKCLWHASVKYTLSVYGRNFDESNGARRIDEWLGAANSSSS